MDKFQNKYRIPSARAPFWNYGWNALYFVTICTDHRICWFGQVVDGEMVLSEIGEMVKSEWLKTFDMRPDMQSKNLASIIRGFKIGVTKNARIIQSDFAWQPRYHDHIIRDDQSYHTISAYIVNNPVKWADDKFHRS